MKKLILLSILCSSFNLWAECVHEKVIKGSELLKLKNSMTESYMVETKDAIFEDISKITINPLQNYRVQIQHQQNHNKNFSDYNKTYIEYYGYPRMQKYLSQQKSDLQDAGLEIRVIGKSIKGRDLYAITPKKLEKKKTILMFGRHHGDEGTANWIIEGFFNEYLNNKKFRDEYQLVLYPMINPDGAEAKSRYNANGRDLNRSWNANAARDFDEVKTIHADLRKVMAEIKEHIFIALDMHGSFTQDFFYRVDRHFLGSHFFQKQQAFIDELSVHDPWQAGQYQLSNGDPGMARIVLINHYGKNALTHETVRDIPLRNSKGRSQATLLEQGHAIIKSIMALY
jgi:hypothetical protein